MYYLMYLRKSRADLEAEARGEGETLARHRRALRELAARNGHEIRRDYVFDSRASYSVPPALEAFFESDSYESAIRKAISIGGDSDTIACITGGIAEAYYREIPKEVVSRGNLLIDSGLRRVIREFRERFAE